jgi:uncharacterized protein
MSDFPKTERNQVRRAPVRASYDPETIYAIVDEAAICHVGFAQEAQPFVIPINHARMGDQLLFHGATGSRLIRHVAAGHEICVAVTILDGLVLARSVAHHSMNYRSAVLFGRGRLVENADEKLEALRVITEKILPGRWQDARLPTVAEIAGTGVVTMAIKDASAKVRSGPPGDVAADYVLPIWAGEVPIRQVMLDPIPDPKLADGIAVPDYIRDFSQRD